MASTQDTQFQTYAGQLVAGGIGENLPIKALEEGTVSGLNNQKINGLSAKIKDIFIRETRVFNSPIERYVTKWDSRYGAGIEQAMFSEGAPNAKLDGACMPWGNPELVSQMNLANFAYDVDVSVRDHEVDLAVMDDGQVGAYVAQKLRTPLVTIGQLRYRAWIQLISDIVDGTRSISSNSSSAGDGTSVTYSPTVQGYAGVVTALSAYIPEVERGKLVTPPAPKDALELARMLEGAAADFAYMGADYNALNAMTVSTGTPLLIMEQKVLDAMDLSFAYANANNATQQDYGFGGFPTISFRDYVRRFSELVEIDSFAALPTGSSSTNRRCGAVLIDRDAFVEKINYADVESFRCAKERATGYSYQGSSALSIWTGANSFAVTFSTQEPSPPGP